MSQEDFSKEAFLEERKERKKNKRAEKRRARLISFFQKAACGAVAVILICVVTFIVMDRPLVKEEDTFPYVGKCADVYRWSKGFGKTKTSGIDIRFEDGYRYTWRNSLLSDEGIESMKGSKLILMMAEDQYGDMFPVAFRHEDGYIYYTLEEHNASELEYRQTVWGLIHFTAVFFYLVFFLAGYPYPWKPYPRKNSQARKR